MDENLATIAAPETVQAEPAPAPKPQKKRRRRKKTVRRIITLVIALAVVGGIVFGMLKLFAEPDASTTALTEFTYRGSIQSKVEGYGLTTPKDSAAVAAVVSGLCEAVYVSTGDYVNAGDPLFDIDIAQADKLIAEKQEALDALLKDRQDIYDTQAKLSVTAPISGKLIGANAVVGDFISKGDLICTIVDDSKLRLTQYFSYAYQGEIRAGQSVDVAIPSSMTTIKGTVEKVNMVERISPEGGKLFEAVIVVPNPGTLTEETIASASIVSASGETMYPYESGKLEFYEKRAVTAGATGTCISVNMINYMKYSAGAVLCQLDSDAYEEELKEINERIEAAQEALDAELAKLEKYHGVAPISGTVMGCSFVEGEETVVGTSSITISDTSVIYLEAQIDEMDVSKVSIGMPVEVSQYDENIYQGTVVSISSEGKFEGGYSYFPAMIELPNDGRLMVGMYCTFSFVSSQVDDCVIAPVQSVKYTEQGTCLFVKADERPESAIDLGEGIVPEGFFAVPVEVGLSDDTGVEIKSGVGEGVEVFTSMLVNQGNSWQDQAGGGVKVAIG